MTPEELARRVHPGSVLELMFSMPGADRAAADLGAILDRYGRARITKRVSDVGVTYGFVPIGTVD